MVKTPSTSGIKKRRLSRHRRKILLHQISLYKERLKSKDVRVIGRLLIHFKYQIILYLQTFSSYTTLKPETKTWEAEAKHLLIFVRQYAEKVEETSQLQPPESEWYKIDSPSHTVTFKLLDIDGKIYQYSTSITKLRNNFVYSKEHNKVIISSEYTVYCLIFFFVFRNMTYPSYLPS